MVRSASRAEPRPRRGTHVVRALALGLLAVVPLGCGVRDPVVSAEPSAPTLRVDWGPLAVVQSRGNGQKARTEGVIEITETCVFVTRGPERTQLGWPSERTRWLAEARAIDFATSRALTVTLFNGSEVVLGGSALSGIPDWLAAPRPECHTEEIWFIGDVASP